MKRASKLFIAIVLLSVAVCAIAAEPAEYPSGNGGFYKSPTGWVEIRQTVSLMENKVNPVGVLVPFMALRSYFTLAGANAGVQVKELRPTFYLANTSLDDRLTVISALVMKDDERRMPISKLGKLKSVIPVEITLISAQGMGSKFLVRPKQDLKPGEYIVTYAGGPTGMGFDFGVPAPPKEEKKKKK